jgi:hypothetical protein
VTPVPPLPQSEGRGVKKVGTYGTYILECILSQIDEMVRAAVRLNMRHKADEQELSAAGNGVDVVVEIRTFAADGSKNYATVLAETLCLDPKLADGTRQQLANLITTKMKLPAPFNPTRLSRVLSAKAKVLVDKILARYGYNPAAADTGVGIRDAVKAGKELTYCIEETISTTFHAGGISLGKKRYEYERVATYETGKPWYYLGVRFAGDIIQLKTILAMRNIGIGEFINADEAAVRLAGPEEFANRKKLDRVAG